MIRSNLAYDFEEYDNVVPMHSPYSDSIEAVLNENDAPVWIKSVTQKLKDISRLKENWNSYGAKPVVNGLPLDVLGLLWQVCDSETPEPSIFATQSGHIQVEWDTPAFEIEMVIASPIDIKFYMENLNTGNVVEQNFDYELEELIDSINLLSQ